MPKRYRLWLNDPSGKVPKSSQWRQTRMRNATESNNDDQDQPAGPSNVQNLRCQDPDDPESADNESVDADNPTEQPRSQDVSFNVAASSPDMTPEPDVPTSSDSENALGSNSDDNDSSSNSSRGPSSNGSDTSLPHSPNEAFFHPEDEAFMDEDELSDVSEGNIDREALLNEQKQRLTDKFNLDDEIPPSSGGLTKFQILLLVFQFAMRFSLPLNGIQALLEMINLILGTIIIPPSTYYFSKIFESSLRSQFHFFCPRCSYYCGQSATNNPMQCPQCAVQIPRRTSGKIKNFFMTLSVKDQLRMRLERDGDSIIKYRRNRQHAANEISDVFDGELFQTLSHKVRMQDSDITITANTDGSPVFKSTTKSLWPIQFRINEVPPEQRFSVESMMVAGLWFSQTAISMSSYLSPFIRELKELSVTGIQWYSKEQKKIITTRIFLLHTCFDSTAKPKILNMKQFNGAHGCNLCYHPGNDWDGGGNIRYSPHEEYEERTDGSIRQDMQTAHTTRTETKGMKGISPLAALDYFSMTYGIVVDIMHSHFLGVAKYLYLQLWTKSSLHQADFHLTKAQIRKIDEKLMNLRPPKDISRDIRPLLSTVKDWKASEWRSWVYFYGPICLQDILPLPYFKNFCRLSSGIYILSQAVIKRVDLEFSRNCLLEFVEEFHELYGLQYCTYNSHLTTHLTKCVEMNGPLWAYSLFPYEGGNGHLVGLVMGANGVPQQIARIFSSWFSLPETLALHPALIPKVIEYCVKLMNFARFKKFSRHDSVVIVGNKKKEVFLPSDEEMDLIDAKGIEAPHFFEVKKIIHGAMYMTMSNSSPRRDDSAIVLKDGRFAKINRLFITSTDNDNVYAFIQTIRINERSFPGIAFRSHIKLCQPYAFDSQSLINAQEIGEKCIFLSSGNGAQFVIRFPNKFEKD